MTLRKHTHTEFFDASTATLFDLLVTPSAIRKWWGASQVIIIKEKGGCWTASWGDDENNPEYISHAEITVYEPSHRLVLKDKNYYAKSGGLPFEADFTTEFIVSESDKGATLTVTQHGFPKGQEADEYYQACQTGWKEAFKGIRKYLQV